MPKKKKIIIGGSGGIVAPAPKIHGSDAPRISGAGGVSTGTPSPKTIAEKRCAWVKLKLNGRSYSLLATRDEYGRKHISLRTLVAYFREGKTIRKEALVDALDAHGYSCTLDEIPA